ncbi:hypothetical protein AX16_001374 [Volvariella volvacea WC 439]|nr:hypothetical protein AX16_001374 [Volvariella volvacea WC 439]
MVQRLSLAEQITQLDDAAPVDFDPEDTRNVDAEDGMDVDEKAGREHYFEVGPSSLRKLHDNISDPKYDGVKTSRKQLQAEFQPSKQDESEEGDGGGEAGSLHSGDEELERDYDEEESDGESFVQSESQIESGEDEAPPKTPNDMSIPISGGNDMAAALQRTREADRKKGKAVARQIAIWDAILDARIQLQKAVTAANRLPPPAQASNFKSEECVTALNEMIREAALLSDELFELEDHLVDVNEVAKPPPRKRRKLDELETIDQLSSQLQYATRTAADYERELHPYLLQTLSKWSAKVQAVAPSALLPSTRNAFTKNNQHLKSVVQLIDENLIEQDKLLSRTRLKRGKGVRIGVALGQEDSQAEADVEIFDDTDFYQQLLRDIIDSRGENTGMSDWMAAQKEKKAKKTVDPKASKGRKIRYQVHEKIQNFMVPVPVVGGWHEEQIDELFASLLGKGFESHMADEEREHKDMEDKVEEAIRGGFRVFS